MRCKRMLAMVLGAVLALALCLALPPETARAATGDVYIGNKKVSGLSYPFYLREDLTETTTPSESAYEINYSASANAYSIDVKKSVTLNVTNSYDTGSSTFYAGIYAEGVNLTINIPSGSTFTVNNTEPGSGSIAGSYGVYVNGKLRTSAGGALTVSVSGGNFRDSAAIHATNMELNNSVTATGGNVSSTTSGDLCRSYGITGSELHLTADTAVVTGNGGNTTAKESTSESAGIRVGTVDVQKGSVVGNGGTATVNGANSMSMIARSYGVTCGGWITVHSGGVLTGTAGNADCGASGAYSNSDGVNCAGNITVEAGGTLTGEGKTARESCGILMTDIGVLKVDGEAKGIGGSITSGSCYGVNFSDANSTTVLGSRGKLTATANGTGICEYSIGINTPRITMADDSRLIAKTASSLVDSMHCARICTNGTSVTTGSAAVWRQTPNGAYAPINTYSDTTAYQLLDIDNSGVGMALTAAPASLDFGARVVDTSLPDSQSVTITNTSGVSVTLNDPTVANDAFTLSLSTKQLAPSGTATLTVRPKSTAAIGTFSDTVLLTGTNGASLGIPVSYTVIAKMTVSLAADKTAILRGNKVTLTATVTDGTPPYTYRWSNGSETKEAVSPYEVYPAQAPSTATSVTYTVTVKDACNVEVTSAPVTVTVQDSESKIDFHSTSELTGWNPPTLDFGKAVEGYTNSFTPKYVVVTNTGMESLKLNALSAPNGYVVVPQGGWGNTIDAGEARNFSIKPKDGNDKLAPGTYDADINIGCTTLGNTLTLRVKFKVESPSYTLAAVPATCDFGAVAEGYPVRPSHLEVTVTNTGNSPVHLSALNSTAAFEITLPANWADELAAGGTRVLRVQPKAGLRQGGYSQPFTVQNTEGGSASFTAVLAVQAPPVAPTLSGDTELTLIEPYSDTETSAYTATGSPAPTITKTSGDSRILWDAATGKLRIPAGMPAGKYLVKLTASNGIPPDAELTFTLTVVSNPAGENRIDNIVNDQKFVLGDTVTFTAVGGGTDNLNPHEGDMRWEPTQWEINPQGTFGGVYTQSFPTLGMSLGDHTLFVTFTLERYSAAAWYPLTPGVTNMQSVRLKIVSSNPDDSPDEPDRGITLPLAVKVNAPDIYAAPGETARMQVTATGSAGPFHFQWYKRTGPKAPWQKIAGATELFYDTSRLKLSNDGFQYSCLVTDNMIPAAQVRSAVIQLHVGDENGAARGVRPLPPTGDGQRPLLWLGLCALCGAGLIVLSRKKRKA